MPHPGRLTPKITVDSCLVTGECSLLCNICVAVCSIATPVVIVVCRDGHIAGKSATPGGVKEPRGAIVVGGKEYPSVNPVHKIVRITAVLFINCVYGLSIIAVMFIREV